MANHVRPKYKVDLARLHALWSANYAALMRLVPTLRDGEARSFTLTAMAHVDMMVVDRGPHTVVLDIRQLILNRQCRRSFVKYGIGLDGQLVPGQVWRIKGQCAVQVGLGSAEVLSRQTVHQVDIEAVKAGGGGKFDSGPGLVAVVYSPQCLQSAVVKALDAQ